MNPLLLSYIESTILPLYASFDTAHREDHVKEVIARSMELAQYYDVDEDMVYTVAAYHDTGLCQGREFHHKESARILLADICLRRWFNDSQIQTMADAVEDHRASSSHAPRSIYGCIVAEADRLIDPMVVVRRTIQYGLSHYPQLDKEAHFQRTCMHIQEKYMEGGYLKLWIHQSPNANQLASLRSFVRNQPTFRPLFAHLYNEECTLKPSDTI